MAEILIIEDDEVFSEYMEDRNHEPQTAHTLEQARERLAVSIPDAILLDQQLPDGLGIRYAVKRSPYCHAALTAAVVSGGVDGADPDNEGGNARGARCPRESQHQQWRCDNAARQNRSSQPSPICTYKGCFSRHNSGVRLLPQPPPG